MNRASILEQLDAILDLLSPQVDGGHGGLSEQRRKLLLRLVKALRDQVSKSKD